MGNACSAAEDYVDSENDWEDDYDEGNGKEKGKLYD